MVVTSLLAALLALASAQPRDPTTPSRDAYNRCLRQFMDRNIQERTAQPAFETALAQQCTEQEAAYRQAIRAREAGFRTPAAEIERTANEEIEDARANFRELFAMSANPN